MPHDLELRAETAKDAIRVWSYFRRQQVTMLADMLKPDKTPVEPAKAKVETGKQQHGNKKTRNSAELERLVRFKGRISFRDLDRIYRWSKDEIQAAVESSPLLTILKTQNTGTKSTLSVGLKGDNSDDF